jgi:hypothetical protein
VPSCYIGRGGGVDHRPSRPPVGRLEGRLGRHTAVLGVGVSPRKSGSGIVFGILTSSCAGRPQAATLGGSVERTYTVLGGGVVLESLVQPLCLGV